MGIQGLIPFLEKASTPINIKEFSGDTVAIDAYCWLHKGVFSCADKLARGDVCDMYVVYCMKFINMLLSYNIKPILIFDGQKLPAKANTEKKRRALREQNRKKAAELMRLDRGKEAQTYLRRCIDVTHEMALNLIHVCRSRNIDCIVAPYEADAQLAYLNIQKIAEVVITEDSDLLLFGAKKVLFKMDSNGNGLLVEQEKLHICMGVKLEKFSFDKFRYMCILSGCDYLSSLPGIGLAKACRFINRTADPDIYRAISRIGLHLNMSQLNVPKEYKDNFMAADFMFKYQPVFDPFKKKLVPLTDVSENDDNYKKFLELISVNHLSDEQICQLAYGNLDPLTLLKLDDWSPDSLKVFTKTRKSCNANNVAPHPSIWDKNFTPTVRKRVNSSLPNALNQISSFTKIITRDINQNDTTARSKINGKDIAEQLEQMKNVYQSQYENCNESNTDMNEGRKNKSESVLTNIDHVESELNFVPHSELKNSGVLSEFVSLYKSVENKNSSKVISRYFVSNVSNTGSSEANAEIKHEETKQNKIARLLGNLEKRKSVSSVSTENSESASEIVPVKQQRSPLQTKTNFVDNEYTGSDTQLFAFASDSSDQKSKFIGTNNDILKNKTRKRSNPFAITNEKNACVVNVNEPGTDNNCDVAATPNHQINDIKKIRKGITFKWAEDFNGNFRHSDTSVIVKDAIQSSLHEKETLNHSNENCNERLQTKQKEYKVDKLLRSCNTENNMSFTPIRLKHECRTPGLLKKPIQKQQSLLHMFAFRNPKKLKT